MRRLLTMLAATALLAGGVGAVPAQAAPAVPDAGAGDAVGDAEGGKPAARAAADIRKVRYIGPSEPDGVMRLRVKWEKLYNGRREGAPNQRFFAILAKPGGDEGEAWLVTATNRTKKVAVYQLDRDALRGVQPKKVSLRREFKRGGFMTISFSTEWLPIRTARIFGEGTSNAARDTVLPLRVDVSGRSGASSGPAPAPSPAREAKKYANCTALQRDWPNGVAQGPKAARKQVRDGNSRPASGKRARAVYQTNKGPLDRDKDGTACEN